MDCVSARMSGCEGPLSELIRSGSAHAARAAAVEYEEERTVIRCSPCREVRTRRSCASSWTPRRFTSIAHRVTCRHQDRPRVAGSPPPSTGRCHKRNAKAQIPQHGAAAPGAMPAYGQAGVTQPTYNAPAAGGAYGQPLRQCRNGQPAVSHNGSSHRRSGYTARTCAIRAACTRCAGLRAACAVWAAR
jgi:hypothetical protein